MTFKKTEKEIIKAIVKYGEKEHSMAKGLNKSKLLENRGLVIAFASGRTCLASISDGVCTFPHHLRKTLAHV